jgi:hypothetical protein
MSFLFICVLACMIGRAVCVCVCVGVCVRVGGWGRCAGQEYTCKFPEKGCINTETYLSNININPHYLFVLMLVYNEH